MEDGVVYGRGSADMKGALACAAEVARVVKASGSFPGSSSCSRPGSTSRRVDGAMYLAWLLGEHGFHADAVVVCELAGGDSFIAAHTGCATFEPRRRTATERRRTS